MRWPEKTAEHVQELVRLRGRQIKAGGRSVDLTAVRPVLPMSAQRRGAEEASDVVTERDCEETDRARARAHLVEHASGPTEHLLPLRDRGRELVVGRVGRMEAGSRQVVLAVREPDESLTWWRSPGGCLLTALGCKIALGIEQRCPVVRIVLCVLGRKGIRQTQQSRKKILLIAPGDGVPALVPESGVLGAEGC